MNQVSFYDRYLLSGELPYVAARLACQIGTYSVCASPV